MNVGTEIVVHKVEFPHIQKTEIDSFKLLTVVEIKNDVRGMFSGKKEFTGYRAIDEKGESFFLNWDVYPDDAMCPVKMWHAKVGEELDIWYDVTQVIDVQRKPKWLSANLEFDKLIGYCERHRCLFYRYEENGCWNCHLEFLYPNRKEEWDKAYGVNTGW